MSEVLRKSCKTEEACTDRLAFAVIAACGLLPSAGLVAGMIYLFLALASLVAPRPVPALSAARLRAALFLKMYRPDTRQVSANPDRICT
jgi:hypothetical protein